MISEILWNEKKSFLAAFHTGILYGLLNTWIRCGHKQPQEPDLVAGLVLQSTPLFYAGLSQIFLPHNLDISLAAAFCHQKPQVSYSASEPACELGDLLYVYMHTPKHGPRRRNALLLQAKMSHNQNYRIKQAEKHQLRLYSEWPDFTYTRSSTLNGHSRSVGPKAPHPGAQYLLIDDRSFDAPESGLLGFPGTYPIGCCMPCRCLHDHADLATEFFNFLLFRTGRAFSDQKTAELNEGWSMVVWDIIKSSLTNSFNRLRSGYGNSPRAIGTYTENVDGCFFARASSYRRSDAVEQAIGSHGASVLFELGNDEPPKQPNRAEGFEPRPGVSVILIETSERTTEG